jgi:hypothetical protein
MLQIYYNGRNSKFVIPDHVPSGYYVVNVFSKFQENGFNAVYTGKLHAYQTK